ncbi:MAG: tRNA pseudouridine(38-40) synthase TruA [Holosporales bacterium]|jgi:tRNA pseudouridine38-40 synthase|nr:tRNA pseudouridine(38-40) synthase TruA [Holosporales bacterium]
MFRYKIKIEYDGSFFCGWQRQASDDDILNEINKLFFVKKVKKSEKKSFFCESFTKKLPSVQSVIENAVEQMTGQKVLAEGAGRTDAGVHATGQVAHFDLPSFILPEKLQIGLNFYLKNLGAIIRVVEQANDAFHARFSAKMRQYEYHIINRLAPLAIKKNYAWHVARPLNIEVMKEAASVFIGYHNFNSFRSKSCQAQNPFRTVKGFDLMINGEEIIGTIEARSFLHNQVRIMIGTLELVGRGELRVSELKEILEARDRTLAGQTAPAYGLYLTNVSYN